MAWQGLRRWATAPNVSMKCDSVRALLGTGALAVPVGSGRSMGGWAFSFFVSVPLTDESDLGDCPMKSLATACLAVLLVVAAACGCRGEPASDQHRVPLEHTLVGRLLLPTGSGSRGVEVLLRTAPSGSEPRTVWVLFDEQGLFPHTFRETLTSVTLTAGSEVYRVDAGEPSGEVRVAMFFGPPPVGPEGEPVSLGSRQFPPVDLDSDVEWLLPHEAQGVYFLVERPAGSGRGTEWRSGQQRLFGPFTSAELPTELIME